MSSNTQRLPRPSTQLGSFRNPLAVGQGTRPAPPYRFGNGRGSTNQGSPSHHFSPANDGTRLSWVRSFRHSGNRGLGSLFRKSA